MRNHLRGIALGVAVFSQIICTGAQADTAAAATSVEKKQEERPKFLGFGFDFTLADSSGLNNVGHNYRNDLDFYFEPSWALGARFMPNTRFKTFSIRARFAVTEYLSGVNEEGFSGNTNTGPQGTCGNPQINQNGTVNPSSVGYCNQTPSDRRTDYSDIWLTIANPKIYTIPKLGIDINPSLRFYLPTSAQSRYQTLILGLRPGLSISRNLWRDHIQLMYGFSFTKNFHEQTTARLSTSSGSATTEASGYQASNVGGLSNFYIDPTRSQTVGGFNTSYSIGNTFDASFHFLGDKLSFDVMYILMSSFAYDHSCTVTVDGMTIDTCKTGSAVAASSNTALAPGSAAASDTQIFWATLTYQPLDWLGLSLMWINWAPLRKPDNSFRQGIISTNYDAFTTISLGTTISIEKVAGKFRKN